MRSRARKIEKIPGEREREEQKKGKKEGDKITTGRGEMRLRERRERGRCGDREKEGWRQNNEFEVEI